MQQRSRIVDIELPDGEVIAAEVVLAGAGGDAGALDRLKLDETRAAIGRIGRWVVEEVRAALPDKPTTLGVEFGLKFGMKSGKLTSVLAEASGEASVVIRLEWKTS
ncbi:CU044_2847 family protein [Longispora albida]|uniref:CU044_2847 family protein n=1 Tax=Longispora albida TaxID=203523 RepID=UPI000367265C|nr:CU044_2847 family protein [Longispora albida]